MLNEWQMAPRRKRRSHASKAAAAENQAQEESKKYGAEHTAKNVFHGFVGQRKKKQGKR